MIDSGLPLMANLALAAIQDEAPGYFRLTWQGSKVPRGAAVGGALIGWTQNGQVLGKGGEMLGTYERIEEWSGPERDGHEMRVYADSQVFSPDGEPCEFVRPGAEVSK